MNSQLPSPPAGILRYDDVQVRFDRFTRGDDEKGFAPGYHFRVLTSESVDVGHINIRVGDSDHVMKCAGHLGFEIDSRHRGNGYASKACLALVDFVSTLFEAMIITVDTENIASKKTIERIGAVFIDAVDVPRNDPHYARGSRRKLRYCWDPVKSNKTEMPTE